MGILLANRDAPSRCTATDCLVLTHSTELLLCIYHVYDHDHVLDHQCLSLSSVYNYQDH